MRRAPAGRLVPPGSSDTDATAVVQSHDEIVILSPNDTVSVYTFKQLSCPQNFVRWISPWLRLCGSAPGEPGARSGFRLGRRVAIASRAKQKPCGALSEQQQPTRRADAPARVSSCFRRSWPVLLGVHAGGIKPMRTTHLPHQVSRRPVMVLKKGIWSRYSTDGTEYAEDRPLKRFSSSEYALGSAQLELPEWLRVPLRQIPPEYEFVLANFNTSAVPHSGLWVYNYVRARERPGLPEWSSSELGARQFWAQVHLDVERMPKVRRYLKDRRRRPALAAARLRLEKLVALPDAGVANGEAEVEAAARAVPPSDSTKKWLELLKDNAADPHQTSADWCI